jgi:predicted dehydrogenase
MGLMPYGHSMTATIGATVIGTGSGVVNHVRAMQGAGIVVRALVGRDPERTVKRAAMFGIEQPTTSLAAALERDDVQIVAVATPPATHAEMVLEVIRAGKHVMCEKPFASSASEARSMLSAAEDAGVLHFLGTEFRFAQGQGLLTRTVASGVIGNPQLAVFALHMPTLAGPGATMPAWWDDAEQGGGWLGSHGTHMFDQMRLTFGDIVAVSASIATLSPRGATSDDTYTAQFATTTGGTGVLHSSCAAAGPYFAIGRIVGTKGSAWLDNEDVWVETGRGPTQVPPADDLPAMRPQPAAAELIETTYDAMRSGGVNLGPFTRLYEIIRDRLLGLDIPDDPEPATFADGLANQLMLDAARASASRRAWVEVDRP